MYEIVKEDDMKNMNQNICNNEYKFVDNELLESTKLSNRINVLVANRSEIRWPESEALLQPLCERIIFLVSEKNLLIFIRYIEESEQILMTTEDYCCFSIGKSKYYES
jgi:hypothetical protein